MTDLLPCRVCGERPTLIVRPRGFGYECPICQVAVLKQQTEGAARRLWNLNQRHARQRVLARLDEKP